MIKGMTLVSPVSTGSEFERLGTLLSALGFETGKGWQDAEGRGAAFLAPLGNLEFVTGRPPATPQVLIEVTQLDHLRTLAEQWLLGAHRTEEIPALLSPTELTHWNSRMFTVQLTPELKAGFWQSEDPLHNTPKAIEGDLSAVGMRFAIVTTRWEHRHHGSSAAGLAGLLRSQRRGAQGYRDRSRSGRVGGSVRGAFAG